MAGKTPQEQASKRTQTQLLCLCMSLVVGQIFPKQTWWR